MTSTPPAAGSRPLGVPSPSSGQSRAFLMALAVLLLVTAAPAQEPARLFPAKATGRGGPGGFVSMGPLFYDTEGRAGVYRPNRMVWRGSTTGITESGIEFYSFFGAEGFVPDVTPGEAFFWEHQSLVPGYERIVGMGVVEPSRLTFLLRHCGETLSLLHLPLLFFPDCCRSGQSA